MADTRSARKRVSDAFFQQVGNEPYLPEFVKSLIPTLREPGSDIVERVWAWCRWRGWGNSSRCPVSHWEPERARLLGQLDCAIDLMWFEEGRPVEEIATASQEMRDQEHDRARSRKDSVGRAFRKVQDRGQIDIAGRQIYLLEAPADRDKDALVAGSRDYLTNFNLRQRDRFDKDPEFIKSLTDLGSRDYEEWKEVRTRYLEVRNRLRSRYKKWRDPATNGGRILIDVIPTNNEEEVHTHTEEYVHPESDGVCVPPAVSVLSLPEPAGQEVRGVVPGKPQPPAAVTKPLEVPASPHPRIPASPPQTALVPRFDPEPAWKVFWTAYISHPYGVPDNEDGARNWWRSNVTTQEYAAAIIDGLVFHLSSDRWKRGIGIPNAARFLNEHRYKQRPRAAPPRPMTKAEQDREKTRAFALMMDAHIRNGGKV